jgi:hypothetical protein
MSEPISNRSFKYCILRSNSRLRSLIKLQIKRKQTSLKKVCEEHEIDYDKLRKYMADPYFERTPNYASQKDVMALAHVLGIQVDLSFTIVK